MLNNFWDTLDKLEKQCAARMASDANPPKIQATPVELPDPSSYNRPVAYSRMVAQMRSIANFVGTNLSEGKNFYEVRKMSGQVIVRLRRNSHDHKGQETSGLLTINDQFITNSKLRRKCDYLVLLASYGIGREEEVAPAPLNAGVDGAAKYAEIGSVSVQQPLAYSSVKTPNGRHICAIERTRFYGKGYTEKTPRSKGARMKGCKLTSGVTG